VSGLDAVRSRTNRCGAVSHIGQSWRWLSAMPDAGDPVDPVGLQRIPAGKLQPSAEVLPAVAAVVVA
jgi:hypothetical protein